MMMMTMMHRRREVGNDLNTTKGIACIPLRAWSVFGKLRLKPLSVVCGSDALLGGEPRAARLFHHRLRSLAKKTDWILTNLHLKSQCVISQEMLF